MLPRALPQPKQVPDDEFDELVERAIAAGIAVSMSAENTPALAHRLRRMLNKRKTPDAAKGATGTENTAAAPIVTTGESADTNPVAAPAPGGEGATPPSTETTADPVPPTGTAATSDSPGRAGRRVSAAEVLQIE